MMPVIVVDIPPEAGKALLSFLYCGEAHVPVTVIPHLVLGAKFLGISGFGDPVRDSSKIHSGILFQMIIK